MAKSSEARTGCTSAHIAAAANSLGLSTEEKAHVYGLEKLETRTESSTREREFTASVGMEESCKRPGELLKDMRPQDGGSSFSEYQEQVNSVSSLESGRELKAAGGVSRTKKRRFTPKEVRPLHLQCVHSILLILFHSILFISGDSGDDAHDPGLCHPPGNFPTPAGSRSSHLCGCQRRPLRSPTECHGCEKHLAR